MDQEKLYKNYNRLQKRYPNIVIRKNGSKIDPTSTLKLGEPYDLEVQIVSEGRAIYERINELSNKNKINYIYMMACVSWIFISILFSYFSINHSNYNYILDFYGFDLVPFILFILQGTIVGIIFFAANEMEKGNDPFNDLIASIIAGCIIFSIPCYIPMAITYYALLFFNIYNLDIVFYSGIVFPVSLGLFVGLGSIIEIMESKNIIKKSIYEDKMRFNKLKEFASSIGEFEIKDDMDLIVIVKSMEVDISPEIYDLKVPKTGDSQKLLFKLRPKEKGASLISIKFYYEGSLFGNIKRQVTVE
jgi:hypothetical protein